MSEGVTNIEKGTFCQCYSLKSVILPENMTPIGAYAFQEAPITTLTIPEGVTEIGSNAFWRCRSLKKIAIPGSVTAIDSTAFTTAQI
ncbi:MAG: leucine-rich repeat domain-containing protein [Oscillospiraceae bacterium]|nr:leucine-rich repeat domain-containing protein [Oscillospiraceae bacterium]